MKNSTTDRAHELWSAAQLAPGEGIEDGVARIEALLALPAPAGEPEMPANAAYWWSPKDGAMAGTWSSNTGPHPDWDVTHYFTTDQLRAYGDARAEHARKVAAQICDDKAARMGQEAEQAVQEGDTATVTANRAAGLVLLVCAARIRAAAPP